MTKKKSSPLAVLALKVDLPSPVSIPDELILRMAGRFPAVSFHACPFDMASFERIEEAEIIYAFTITKEHVKRAVALKWFHSVMTGPDALPLADLKSRGVAVTTPRGLHAIPIAETALGLMLSFARRIRDCISYQASGRWGGLDIMTASPCPSELFGSSVMIVGLGGIGTELAKRCHLMGMNVTAVVRKESPRPDFVKRIIPFSRMRGAIKEADFVVLTCPLTDKTRGMIGEAELSSMKKSAFLINVARGSLVDEVAATRALTEGRIAGAAFDVFEVEPLPEGHPFYRMQNVIVTPHVSGISDRYWERCAGRFEENLSRYLKEEELIGEVDFKRGY